MFIASRADFKAMPNSIDFIKEFSYMLFLFAL